MSIVAALLCLFVVEAPAPKPLWSNTKLFQPRLLTTSPDGKVLFTLQPTEESERPRKFMINRWELATGKKLESYDLEEIETDEYSSSRSLWREASFHASPDAKTLLVSVMVPNSSTRNNIPGYSHVQVYDLATGKKRGELIKKVVCMRPGAFAEESASCFSPDGKWFWAFSVRFAEQIDVYSCETGRLETTIKASPSYRYPQSISFTEEGTRAAVFYQTEKNGYAVAVYDWPSAKPVTEFVLPEGQLWMGLHSWHGNRVCVEVMVEDEESKMNAQAGVPRPIQAWHRHCHSVDITADKPLTTLKREPLLGGFRGESVGMPAIYWDAGASWVATFKQHQQSEQVIQAAAGKRETLPYYWWRDVKVINAKSGKTVFEQKGMPFQSHVTRDGRYLVAVGASPSLSDGIHVWELEKP